MYFYEYFDYTHVAPSACVSTVHFFCPVYMICMMHSNAFVVHYFKLALSLLYFLCFFLCGRTPLCLFYVRCMFSPCWMDQCVSFTHREISPGTLDSFREAVPTLFCPLFLSLCAHSVLPNPDYATYNRNFPQLHSTALFFFF